MREKRRDRSQRSRPSLVDERKRRANQRLQSPTPPRTKAESATRAALIASKHALCVTDPKAVYPEGAWACNMCKRTAHSWWRMWHCTRDGCNHHECDACHEYCPRERAACVEHALPPYWKEAKAPHGHLHAGRSFYYRQYNGSIEKQWECSAVTHTPRAARLKIEEVRIVQLGPHTWMQGSLGSLEGV